MKKWSFCGRVGVLAALTLSALAAANVAAADPGVAVASSVTAAAAPVTQAVPATPALPTPAVPAPVVPAAPAAPAVPAPVASVVGAVPHVAVPHVAVPHVSVGAKAKASVHVSKQHTITVKSSLTAHASVGKTHAKVTASSKAQASKHKVTGRVIAAAATSSQCAGYPMPPYNCSQIDMQDFPAFNSCDNAEVTLNGHFHDIQNVQMNPDGTMTIYHHMNWQNVKGVGTDGNLYTATDVTKEEQQTVPVVLGVHFHTELQEEQNLISLGSDPNQIVHVTTITDVDIPLFIDPMNPPVPATTISGPGLKCTG